MGQSYSGAVVEHLVAFPTALGVRLSLVVGGDNESSRRSKDESNELHLEDMVAG